MAVFNMAVMMLMLGLTRAAVEDLTAKEENDLLDILNKEKNCNFFEIEKTANSHGLLLPSTYVMKQDEMLASVHRKVSENKGRYEELLYLEPEPSDLVTESFGTTLVFQEVLDRYNEFTELTKVVSQFAKSYGNNYTKKEVGEVAVSPVSVSMQPLYQVQEEISSGGEGVILAGFNNATEEHVVIKQELPTTSRRRKTQTPIDKEGRNYGILSRLDCVGQLYFRGMLEDKNSLVLKKMDKDLLQLMIVNGFRLDMQTLEILFFQLLDDYEALHDEKIVHTDVKAENVMVDVLGSRGENRTKLIDFGGSGVLTSDEGLRRDAVGSPLTSSLSQITITDNDDAPDGLLPKHELESLCYMLLLLSKGCVPWEIFYKNLMLSITQIETLKLAYYKDPTKLRDLCRHFPVMEFILKIVYNAPKKMEIKKIYKEIRELLYKDFIERKFEMHTKMAWTNKRRVLRDTEMSTVKFIKYNFDKEERLCMSFSKFYSFALKLIEEMRGQLPKLTVDHFVMEEAQLAAAEIADTFITNSYGKVVSSLNHSNSDYQSIANDLFKEACGKLLQLITSTNIETVGFGRFIHQNKVTISVILSGDEILKPINKVRRKLHNSTEVDLVKDEDLMKLATEHGKFLLDESKESPLQNLDLNCHEVLVTVDVLPFQASERLSFRMTFVTNLSNMMSDDAPPPHKTISNKLKDACFRRIGYTMFFRRNKILTVFILAKVHTYAVEHLAAFRRPCQLRVKDNLENWDHELGCDGRNDMAILEGVRKLTFDQVTEKKFVYISFPVVDDKVRIRFGYYNYEENEQLENPQHAMVAKAEEIAYSKAIYTDDDKRLQETLTRFESQFIFSEIPSDICINAVKSFKTSTKYLELKQRSEIISKALGCEKKKQITKDTTQNSAIFVVVCAYKLAVLEALDFLNDKRKAKSVMPLSLYQGEGTVQSKEVAPDGTVVTVVAKSEEAVLLQFVQNMFYAPNNFLEYYDLVMHKKFNRIELSVATQTVLDDNKGVEYKIKLTLYALNLLPRSSSNDSLVTQTDLVEPFNQVAV